MNSLERFLSRPTAKPYRSGKLDPSTEPHLNDKTGHLDFAPGDIENPKEWSVARRLYITVVSVLMVVNATFASSSPSGSIEGIAEYFQVSREAAGLVITLFLLGYCAGPLFFAPISEFVSTLSSYTMSRNTPRSYENCHSGAYGRRYVFYTTFTAYVAFNFLCAFAPNFGSLLVGRLLTGTFASAPLTNAPGVLADIWDPIQRANAMALFSMMTFVGPALGPVISGFLQLTKGDQGWQWTFYVLIMFGGGTLLLMLTIPETYPGVVLVNKARRLRALNPEKYGDIVAPAEAQGRSLRSMFSVALLRPWQILFDPISFLVAVYLSVVYTLLYMLFSIYPIVFQQMRGWNAGVGQLPLIGTVVGAVIGGAMILYQGTINKKQVRAGKTLAPEDRLPLAMLGGILFAITMFWFSWSANYNSIHWIVPTLAGTFLSSSILLIFVSYLNYLTDTYLMYTASAMAANTICRSACGAAAPLFTNQMFKALGVGGGGSLIGGVAVILAPIPFIFYRYGKGIRVRSKFAPTDEGEKGKKESDDEEKQRKVAGGGEGGEAQRPGSPAPSASSEETLEFGVDYESREDIERRAEHRRERERLEMAKTNTKSDNGL